MRLALAGTLIVAGLAAPVALGQAREVAAGAPFDVSVTVYRDPDREEGGFDLNELQGFALITESRRVVLEPGEYRLRFEGVADGIEPESALVTGLPSGVIEKNRDAMLLSPSALVAQAQARGGRVELRRTNPATGAVERREGVIRSGAEGVVFESADGIEALRCSGLAETFSFGASTTGLSPLPTLSVLTRTTERVEAVVQLSYLSRGFDWAADYTIDMKGGGKTDVGAWVTLANGNGTGFPNARVQVVAGKLNRETGDVEPISFGQPILAYCWPRGSTSDQVLPPEADEMVVVTGNMMQGAPSVTEFVRSLTISAPEDLGDLKLYRVPDRTTIASRQAKQVRMLDRAAVPMTRVYEADFYVHEPINYQPMTILLRTRNDRRNNLGMPLPSGTVYVREPFGTGALTRQVLSAATGLSDTAVDEEVELRLTGSPDVQIRQIQEWTEGAVRPPPPALPGIIPRIRPPPEQTTRLEITNARPVAIQAEVRLGLGDDATVVNADTPTGEKNGRPIFRVTVPANSSLHIRYQTVIRR